MPDDACATRKELQNTKELNGMPPPLGGREGGI